MNVLRDGIVYGAINHGNVSVLREVNSRRLRPEARLVTPRSLSHGRSGLTLWWNTSWGINSGYSVAMNGLSSRTNYA